MSGELLVHADGHVATIREGGLVHVRCGMPHTFATTPGTPARFLVLSTTRPDPMTAALAGRHRHAGIRSFVDDPARRT